MTSSWTFAPEDAGHAGRRQAARFLGYEVVVLHDDARCRHKQRSINANVGFHVPLDVVRAKCQPYQRHGKPIHRPERRHDSDFSIVAQYQAEYRGVVQYYQLAYNVHRFSRLKWVMERSLTTTLAGKHRTRVSKIYKRYAATLRRPEGTYKGLRVVVARGEGRRPLVAEWGGIPLRRRKDAVLNDRPGRIWNVGTELLQRLTADSCELCGSREQVEVHHVRALKALQPMRSGPKPEWAKVMIARKRKALVVCHRCHEDIQHGRPRRQSDSREHSSHKLGQDNGRNEEDPRFLPIAFSTVIGHRNASSRRHATAEPAASC